MNIFSADVYQRFCEEYLLFLPRAGAGVGVFVAFWIGGIMVDRVIRRVTAIRQVDPDVAGLFAVSAKVTLLLFGAISGLGTCGINITAMVAGVGLTGIALGLALKEILSNALAGVMLLSYKPFKRGDTISVTTFEGIVKEVNLRYTVLDSDGQRTFVPNTLLLTNAVVIGKKPTPPENEAKQGP